MCAHAPAHHRAGTILVVALLTMLSSAPSSANTSPTTQTAKTRWSVGTDVFPWFNRGFSLLGAVEPSGLPRLRVGVEVWSMAFPEAFLELNEANAGEGWSRRAEVGVVWFADWFVSGGAAPRSGWHVGAMASVFRSRLEREGVSGTRRFWSGELLARLGYRWMPAQKLGLFINPWVAAGPLTPLGATPTLGGERFDEAPVQVLGTVHVGWRF